MKHLLTGIAVIGLVATAVPAASQQQNLPGTGGVSKPGVPGQPGNKSGTAVRPSGSGRVEGIPGDKSVPAPSAAPRAGSDDSRLGSQGRVEGLPDKKAEPATTSSSPAGSDESGVPGKAGNKAGPALKEPKQ